MKQGMKRILRVLLPFCIAMICFAAVAVTAGADDVIRLGSAYAVGDTINFGENTIIYYNGYTKTQVSGEYTFEYREYSESDGWHRFIVSRTYGIDMFTMWITDSNSAEPTGIRVKAGDGTNDSPFEFEVVYGEIEKPVIISGDRFAIGDKINFGTEDIYISTGDSENAAEAFTGKIVLSYIEYLPDSNQHVFRINHTDVFISDANSARPYGVEVIGGDGTPESPFELAVLREYTASFVGGEATGEGPAPGKALPGKTIKLPDNTFTAPAGKVFAGWYDGTDTFPAGRRYTLYADATFTAVWVDGVAAAYEPNGSTGEIVYGDPVVPGSSISLPANPFTAPEGKLFVGWSDGTKIYHSGDWYTLSDNTTFLAQWWETGYRIPESGSAEADLSRLKVGDSVKVYDASGPDENYGNDWNGTLTLIPPAGKALHIEGFVNTEAKGRDYYDYLAVIVDSQETKYLSARSRADAPVNHYAYGDSIRLSFVSDSINTGKGVRLTVTVVDCLTVTYEPNGGTGTMPDATAFEGQPFTLPACGFTPPAGKAFAGWLFSADESTCRPGDSVSLTGNAAFTAIWEDGISAAYEPNGGTGNAFNGDPVVPGTIVTLPANPFTAPEGKLFAGWSDGTKTYRENDNYTLNADTVFYAQWIPGYFIPGTGAVKKTLSTLNTGGSVMVYDAGGPDGNYEDRSDGSLFLTPPEGKALRITGKVYTEGAYDYFYLYGGSEDNQLLEITGTDEQVDVSTAGSPVIFKLTSDGSKNRAGVELKVSVIDCLTVTYDSNGGTGTMPVGSALEGDTVKLPPCCFTPPTGKAFSGWLSGVDGNVFQPGDSVTVTESATFTARWADAAAVTFNSNGGSDVKTQYIVLGACATEPTPARAGYTFLYWTKDGAGFDFSTPITEDITLTAFWIKGISINEDGENGQLPDGWEIENDSEGYNWQVGTGDYSSSIGAHSGTANFKAVKTGRSGAAWLIMPELDFSTGSSAELNLWYINRSWSSDVDEFGVYYRVNKGGWTEIFSTAEAHESWTELNTILPEGAYTEHVQIAFKASFHYGRGVGLDDVSLEMTTPHTHSWTYAADGATITAACEGVAEGTCLEPAETLTILAPGDLITDGEPKPAALSISGDQRFTGTYTIVYKQGDTMLDGAPSEAGTYTASVTVEGATAEVEYKLGAASAAAAVSANDRPYDGTEQPLVIVDNSTLAGGEMRYALGADAAAAPRDGWDASVPTAASAGTYFVWYKVVGDADHADTVPQPLTVTIRSLFAGHSLSLEGDIGVNFYLNLTEEQAANAAVTFTWKKNGTDKTELAALSAAENPDDGYKATCRVSASEMRTEITATLVIDAGPGEQIEEINKYSVAQYADVILTDTNFAHNYVPSGEKQSLENLRALVSAMLAYGDHARTYFDEKAAALDTPGVVIPGTVPVSETTSLPDGVIFEGATLSLRSRTSLSLYFKKDTGVSDVVLTMDGYADYDTESSGDEYIIRIRNIAAAELKKSFTVKVNGTGSVTYSPLTYCRKAQQNSSNSKLVNTVKALYGYWLAADKFF